MILLLLHSCPHRYVNVSGFFYFLNLSLNLGQDTLQRASVSKVTLKYYFYHLAQTFFHLITIYTNSISFTVCNILLLTLTAGT